MRNELDVKLCTDYPELYQDRHASMQKTLMCWGFSCGDGWYPLIDAISYLLSCKVIKLRRDIAHLEEMIPKEHKNEWAKKYYTQETLNKAQVELEEEIKKIPIAVQVKEKYGTLRFYTNGSFSEECDAYITFAELMSGKICETCGTTKDVFQTEGWIRTTCPSCETQINNAN